MLNKRIPRSKKIGVIGLAVLVLLGAFLLPMARADKKSEVETSEYAVFGTDISVAGLGEVATFETAEPPEEVALESVSSFPLDTVGSTAARGTPSVGIPIVDAVFGKSNAEIQKARAVSAKDMAKIERSKRHIKALRQEIQMHLDMLHQWEAELKLMQPDVYGQPNPPTFPTMRPLGDESMPAAPVNLRRFGARRRDPDAAGETRSLLTERVRGEDFNARYPKPQYDRGGWIRRSRSNMPAPETMGSIRGQKNVSDEVRRELQRILPGLLREMLPRLLAEAMTETAGNHDPYQSMTEPTRRQTMRPPVNAEKHPAFHRYR